VQCDNLPTRHRQPTKRTRHAGGAVVEFALILPVFLIVIMGIVDFSLALYDQAIITNASREAARAGIVLKAPKLTTTQIKAVAVNYCQNYLISMGAAATPTISVTQAASPVFATPLTVTVSYSYTGLAVAPFLTALTGPLVLSATSVMNNE